MRESTGDRGRPPCRCRAAVPCDGDEPRGGRCSRQRGAASCTSRSANRRRRCPRSPATRCGPTSTNHSATPTPPGCTRCAVGSPTATTASTPERILVVAGASAGFTLAFLTLFEPGDRVGVLEPGYPCYRNALLALGMEPVAIPVGPASRWAPTPADLEAAGRPRRAGPRLAVEPDRHRARRRRARRDHRRVPAPAGSP